MDILDFLDILLKPPQPLVGLFFTKCINHFGSMKHGTVSEFSQASQWNLTLDEENISETVTVSGKKTGPDWLDLSQTGRSILL